MKANLNVLAGLGWLILSFPGIGLGQAPKALAAPDHGIAFAAALEVAPGKLKDTTKVSDTTNYVYRSRIISLGADRSVSFCFDTEHMRVAGVWVGKPASYVADKNMGPAVEGVMLFATRPGPGWSKGGEWNDPRPVPEGPLPREWAHYKGIYLNGDRAVLSYMVGDCAVLEMPEANQSGDQVVVSRTFNLGPSARPLSVLVCEEAKGTGWLETKVQSTPPAPADQWRAGVSAEKETIIAGVVGAPREAEWETVGGRLHLKLPALPQGAKFRIAISRRGADKNTEALDKALAGAVQDLTPLTKGGPPRWTQNLQTKGTVSTDTKSAYVFDAIDLPEKNPWRAAIRFGGLDFFPDGRAALSTWDGDVWIVSGLDGKLDAVTWKRFAAGLQQPLGLKIVDGVIYTAGRDQITRLVDLNGDGEADFFENVNNDTGLTLQRHEFVMDLQTDADGNFYFCRSGHYIPSLKGENCCVYKMSSDGRKLEIFARGLREPNGMSIGPDSTMTVGDNEGNGIPQTPIYRLQAGKFYGFTPGPGDLYKLTEKPIVWLPKTLDRSAGGQVWAPKEWGPLGGQLLHTSYGNCSLFAILIDKQGDPWQGAAWTFPINFTSGLMRARFSPTDGQLYVCGLRGWSTNGTKDGQFARIRFTGAKTPVPVGLAVAKKSVTITFSAPLDRAMAENDQNWAGEWILSQNAKKTVKEEMPIEAVKLSKEGTSVTLELERVVPVMNYSLQYRLKGTDGSPVNGTLHGTIHRTP